MDNHIKIGRSATAKVRASRAGILVMHDGRVEIRHGLADYQHILEARAATAIAVLHQHTVAAFACQVHHAGGVAQMAIEGVDTMAKVIRLAYTVALVINVDKVRVSPAGDSFAVDLKGVGAILRRLELVPIGITGAIKTATDHGGQLDFLRLVRLVVRLNFE